MRKTIAPGIAVAAMAIALACPSSGTAGSKGPRVAALRKAALSWVHYASDRNFQKACELQTGAAVNGVPCAQLPTRQVFYCPAFQDDRPTRPFRQLVGRVTVNGPSGAAVLKSRELASRFRSTALFEEVAGAWRIAAVQWPDHRVSPAGLFLEEQGPWSRLWPPC